jgi:DNA modification methylase
MTYDEFIQSKKPLAQLNGFVPATPPHPCLKSHQIDIAMWMARGGRRACFAAFGLGKTRIHLQVAKWICEHDPRKYLIIAPLGVRQEFTRIQGPAMGVAMTYCRTDAEVEACTTQIIITNYERVRDGGINVTKEKFTGIGLDEASVLRSFGSKTYQSFLKMFTAIDYRFVFTATPSPNRHKELIHYGGFLGVMDTGQALTRFFQRDSQKAGNLTLMPSMEGEFWDWLASWSCFLQKPSDLGYSDDGYDMPGLRVHWERVPVDHKKAWTMVDSWGQHQLFLDKSAGLADLAEVKRSTIISRIAKAKEIIEANPGDNFILWHDIEAERRVIQKVIPGVQVIYGTQDLEKREDIIVDFSDNGFPVLGTKPQLSGSGCNLQKHCHRAIFLGSSYKFNDFIQAVHRILRFQQKFIVDIYIIFTESEDAVVSSLKTKWQQHNELVSKMSALLKEYKLDLKTMQIVRKTGCKRIEVKSKTFRAINNDAIVELMKTVDFGHNITHNSWHDKGSNHLAQQSQFDEQGNPIPGESGNWEDSCVDLIVSSIPFGTQYEYSPNHSDLGNNIDNQAFFSQLDYLIPNLLRVLKPGRLACIHVKDRIRFGAQHGTGVPTVDRFSDKTADCFEKHGFFFLGRITIDTDVVRENAQTYRLGWSENAKDSTKMGVGMPEYVLLFRKPHSDLSNAYADLPVTKDKSIYKRAHWQVDASGFWKSDGNRLPDPDIIQGMNMSAVRRLWLDYCHNHQYSWKEHVEIAAALEDNGYLPSSWMLFSPISNHPGIWDDITRMRTLNSNQEKQKEDKHVCPLQLDIVNRLITRYSNPGEIVFDPFAGIFTVPYCAQLLGRIGWGVELATEYWRCGVGYCEQAERERNMPTLFDMAPAIAPDPILPPVKLTKVEKNKIKSSIISKVSSDLSEFNEE